MRLYALVGDADQYGDDLVGLAVVLQEVGQVLRHVELHFGVEQGLARGAALGEESLGVLLEVDDAVALLEAGEAGLDVAQFLAEEDDAAVDEAHGALGHAVFVFDDVLLIDLEQLVEEVLGALRVGVLEGQVDERAFLVDLAGRQVGSPHLGGVAHGHTAHLDGGAGLVLQVHRAGQDEVADRRFHNLAVAQGLVDVERVFQAVGPGPVDLEVVQAVGVVVDEVDLKRDALVLAGGLQEAHLERAVLIERDGTQPDDGGVVDVEFQVAHDALDEAVGLQDEDFVLQLVARGDAVELQEGVHVARHAAAAARARRVLNQDGGSALVDARLFLLVQESQDQADNDGEDEPLPPATQDVGTLAEQGEPVYFFGVLSRNRRGIRIGIGHGLLF